VRKDIAASQAQTLSAALGNAKINIVGGDGAFFDQFMRAVSLSHSVEATATSTDTMKTLLKPYLTGEREFPQDIKDILSKPGLTQDAQNLAAAAALAKFAKQDKK